MDRLPRRAARHPHRQRPAHQQQPGRRRHPRAAGAAAGRPGEHQPHAGRDGATGHPTQLRPEARRRGRIERELFTEPELRSRPVGPPVGAAQRCRLGAAGHPVRPRGHGAGAGGHHGRAVLADRLPEPPHRAERSRHGRCAAHPGAGARQVRGRCRVRARRRAGGPEPREPGGGPHAAAATARRSAQRAGHPVRHAARYPEGRALTTAGHRLARDRCRTARQPAGPPARPARRGAALAVLAGERRCHAHQFLSGAEPHGFAGRGEQCIGRGAEEPGRDPRCRPGAAFPAMEHRAADRRRVPDAL
ncbi:hypothetical protein D3C85_582550 [compost metagenome]